jgi:predicted phage terminase large subunit-like protein
MSLLTKELIKGFVGSCLVKGFDGSKPIPAFHEEMWDLCCSDAKYVAIAAPRGHAKSTAITLSYGLATFLFRERSFGVIVSDSEFQASMFLGQIKQALQENESIINLFHIKKNEKGQVEFEKETETDIIVATEDGHKFRIIAKGSEQKLRGLLWNGKRPDIMLLDDMESDEQVMNKERRDKFRRWFYGALIPALSENGIIRYVGTILHQDAMLEQLMPKVNGAYVIEEPLKMYKSKYAGFWKTVKYRAHSDDWSQILWPDRWSRERLKEVKQEYIQMGLSDKYSQEYLNIPIDESTAFFKRSDFQGMRPDDKKKNLNYYITGDFAISERDRADYTVFVVGGMDEAGLLHIKNVIRARMDGEEIVQTMIGLQKVYNPLAFGVEEMQVSKALGPYLNRAMIESNTYINLILMKPYKQDKMTRSQSIRARMRAGGVKFDKDADWYQDLEEECISFPRAKHDDQVDSLAYLGLLLDKLIDAPTEAEAEDERYLEEFNETGNHMQGRNAITGY